MKQMEEKTTSSYIEVSDSGTFWEIFNYSGRLGRKKYWLGMLEVFFISVFVNIIFAITADSYVGLSTFSTIILVIYCLAAVLCSISATVRRLHDAGKSGWWYFISFVPGGCFAACACRALPCARAWGVFCERLRCLHGARSEQARNAFGADSVQGTCKRLRINASFRGWDVSLSAPFLQPCGGVRGKACCCSARAGVRVGRGGAHALRVFLPGGAPVFGIKALYVRQF